MALEGGRMHASGCKKDILHACKQVFVIIIIAFAVI